MAYSFILLSALMVWWIFGLFASVAAGYTWLPFTSFLSSIIHFGISSWLFLTFPKSGKILSMFTGLLICAWPIIALFSSDGIDMVTSIYFLLVIVLTAIVIYNHVKSFKHSAKPKPLARLILSTIPLGLSIWYVAVAYRYFS